MVPPRRLSQRRQHLIGFAGAAPEIINETRRASTTSGHDLDVVADWCRDGLRERLELESEVGLSDTDVEMAGLTQDTETWPRAAWRNADRVVALLRGRWPEVVAEARRLMVQAPDWLSVVVTRTEYAATCEPAG